jgi:hypothetical protein
MRLCGSLLSASAGSRSGFLQAADFSFVASINAPGPSHCSEQFTSVQTTRARAS